MKSVKIHLCHGNHRFDTCSVTSDMAPVDSHVVISHTGGSKNMTTKQALEFRDALLEQLLWVLPDNGYRGIEEILAQQAVLKTYAAGNEPWADAKNKILVIIGDTENRTPNTDPMNIAGFRVLPVFKAERDENGKMPDVVLAPEYSRYNAEWWEDDISEAVPRLLAMLKMAPEDFKIFISYKRSDTEGVARQLYDALQHIGAEVFLDSYTLASGINFQKRLAQQLSDKAIVVILESPNLTESAWVQRELSLAKIYRLGCCALHFGVAGKHELPQIDADNRYVVKDNDYVDSSEEMKERKLDGDALKEVLQFIKVKHAVALINKHRYLRQSLEKLLGSLHLPEVDEHGYLDIKGAVSHHKVGLNVRPSEARDYFYLHGAPSDQTPLERVIIGPLLHLQERKRINQWLSERAGIKFYNEGELMSFVNTVKVIKNGKQVR